MLHNGLSYYKLVLAICFVPIFGFFNMAAAIPIPGTGGDIVDSEDIDKDKPRVYWEPKACYGDAFVGKVIDFPENNPDFLVKSTRIIENDNFSFARNPKSGPAKLINLKLEVIDHQKDAIFIIEYTDMYSNSLLDTVTYTAPKIRISQPEVKFHKLKLGETPTTDIWLVNYSETDPYYFEELFLKTPVQYFTIHSQDLNTQIPPGDSVKITVDIEARKSGYFEDRIIIGDTCLNLEKASIKAWVYEPDIVAQELNCGYVIEGTSKTFTASVYNFGEVDLVITGAEKTEWPPYFRSYPEDIITENVVVSPGDKYQFQIEFSPLNTIVHTAEIRFQSDAAESDSIMIITATGVDSSFVGSSYNWGRRRLNLAKAEVPSGPYKAPENHALILENRSKKVFEVNVNPPYEADLKNGFIIEKEEIYDEGVEIYPGERFVSPVYFNPTQRGTYSAEYIFETTTAKKDLDGGTTSGKDDLYVTTKVRLEGIGIAGKLSSQDIVMDTSIVDNLMNPSSSEVVISNEYDILSDTVTIYDIYADDNVSTSSSFSSKSFKFNKEAIGLPVTLPPGDSLKFTVYFAARQTGISHTRIYTKSNAVNEDTCSLSGQGVLYGIRATGIDFEEICLGRSSSTYSCSIENFGYEDIRINSIGFDSPENQFEFINIDDKNGFVIPKESIYEVKMKYRPTEVGLTNATMSISYEADNAEPLPVLVSGASIQYDCFSNMILDQHNKLTEIGAQVNGVITVEPDPKIINADLDTLYLEVRYAPGFIKMIKDSILPGEDILGTMEIDRSSIQIDDVNGKMSLLFKAPLGSQFMVNGQILNFACKTYLPVSHDVGNSSTFTHAIYGYHDGGIDSCARFINSGRIQVITLENVCAYEYRILKISNTPYQLTAIRPHPAQGDYINIDYSVGLSGHTMLEIYNNIAEKVAVLNDKYLKEGEYSSRFDLNAIAPGIYYCRISSGPYQHVEKFIVLGR